MIVMRKGQTCFQRFYVGKLYNRSYFQYYWAWPQIFDTNSCAFIILCLLFSRTIIFRGIKASNNALILSVKNSWWHRIGWPLCPFMLKTFKINLLPQIRTTGDLESRYESAVKGVLLSDALRLTFDFTAYGSNLFPQEYVNKFTSRI